MQHRIIWDISRRFRRLSPCDGQVAHVLRTLPPVAARVLLPRAAPRLACVKPAASVHPEPGSNSSLYISYSSSSTPALSIPFKEINALDFCVVGTCFLVLSFQSFQSTPSYSVPSGALFLTPELISGPQRGALVS